MEKKFKFVFNEHEMQESITYILVSKYNIEPNILKAEMDDTGGMMILKLKGDAANIDRGIEYVRSIGIEAIQLNKHIVRDHDTCIDCGS